MLFSPIGTVLYVYVREADPWESTDWMYIFCNLGSYVAMKNITRRLIHKVIDLKQLYLVVCHRC